MKKMLAAIFAGVLISAAPSQALMIGQMRGAETSGWGSLNLTTGIGIFDNVKHLFGTVRYGVASQVDLSGSLALLDHEANEDASLLFNADVQYQFMQSKLGYSFDMAAGTVFEYYSPGSDTVDVSKWTIGLNYIVSKPLKFDNGFAFTPYGRLNVRSDNSNVDGAKSDFNIGVNLGSVFPISSKVSLTGEVQIDDEFGFLAGISFFMW